MREKVIAEYHQALALDDGLNKTFFDHLRSAMTATQMLHGNRPLGVALRPHLLTRSQYDILAHAAETLAGAFNKVSAVLLGDEALMNQIGLRDEERRLAAIDPGYQMPAINTRLDAFLVDDAVKFVEYNAENPSSLADQLGLNQILFAVPAQQQLAARYRLCQFNPLAALLRALLDTYHEWGGRRPPRVAIVDWADLPTAPEFHLVRNYFASRGVPTIICTPEELEYDGQTLRRGEFNIDLVYKRVIIHEFLARYDHAHPLARAYAEHRVCLINSFRCKLEHKKAVFALLTDENNWHWFSAAEREVIARSVPWTRRVSEQKTLYRARTIDLLEHVRRHRELFILKPNDDYGGHGVLPGNQAGAGEWDEMLSVALANDYVVQELIDLRTEEFPVFGVDAWSVQPMYVDTNPFLFRGKMHGAMVRLSASPVVNVTAGGGETGFFVIEGEAGD